jgi:signal transduction histidine kinase/CheY-like chemotaxis protein/AraC-like DNA-binding protein
MPWYRSENPLEPIGFHTLEGSSGQSWQVRPDGSQLYIPHNPGLLTLNEHNRLSSHPLNGSNVYGVVFPASSPGKLIASVDNGLLLVDKHSFSHVQVWTGKETPRYLILNANDELWMITETLRGIYRLRFSDDFLRVISQTWYSTHKGLPDIPVLSLVQDAGNISVLTEEGLYRYDPVPDRFVADSVCNRMVRHGAYLANTDHNGNLWLEGMNYLTKVNRNASGACLTKDTIFRWISPYTVFHTSSLPDGSWLFSTNKGVIRYDSTRDKIPVLHQPLIARVEALGGDSIHLRKGFVLPFSSNSLRFLCAAGCYGESRQYRFRFRLETAGGTLSDWSEWSSSPVKEFTNIPEGTHTFRVVSRDIFGQISPERTFRFEILPPWYRTSLAYGAYFLLVLLIFYLVLRINARHLKRANIRLEQTVQERTREIERQKSEIELLNEFKSRFFSNISHELRTPLTLILSPLEQMEEQTQAPLLKKRLNVMLRNGRKLLSRINQLLDLARLEKGGIRIALQEEEINPVLGQIIEPFTLFAAEKGIRILYLEEHSGIRLCFDRDILEKIIDNLLSNALKFTPPGGEITITLGLIPDKKQVRIIVRDTGTGIAEEELTRIFDRFYQVRDSRGNGQEGTGIGLAFVKELIAMHKGSISVESAPGKGTAFTLLLPAGLQPEPSDSSSTVSADHHPVTMDQAAISATVPGSADTQDKPSGSEIILVVEDNEEMLHFIAESLSDRYRVLMARDGEEGLAVSQKEMPDLIITDVMMPKMDGFAFTRAIRGDRLTSHIPVIMLTAKSSIDSRIEGLEAAADDYLTKPFSVRELTVRIRNLLSLRRMLQKKYRDALLIDPSEVVTNKMDEAFLTKAIRLVEEHMGEPDFGVELLYHEMAMSRSSLHKKLKALTNQSATEFINMIRLKEAARQLRQQSGTVSEIAYRVGFSSIPYFNVCFKRVFGMNPTRYASSGKP